MWPSVVLSKFSTQHSGSGFVPCECSTKLQGDELARCREVAASKQDDEHGPILSRERLRGGARSARVAKGRGLSVSAQRDIRKDTRGGKSASA